MSGPRNAPAGRAGGFEKLWRTLSPGERAELEFRWKIACLWRRGPIRLAEFLALFVADHEALEAALTAYLADEHIGRRARASARNRDAGQRWRQRRRQSTTPSTASSGRRSPSVSPDTQGGETT
jgi:hypothetical protein